MFGDSEVIFRPQSIPDLALDSTDQVRDAGATNGVTIPKAGLYAGVFAGNHLHSRGMAVQCQLSVMVVLEFGTMPTLISVTWPSSSWNNSIIAS
jgi:hypothetical protein